MNSARRRFIQIFGISARTATLQLPRGEQKAIIYTSKLSEDQCTKLKEAWRGYSEDERAAILKAGESIIA
jgi:hypothetical protein